MDDNETISSKEHEWGFEKILNDFIEKIETPSIKNSLKDSIIINRITSDTVYFITISKIAEMVFKNTNHIRYLENKLSEVMGQQTAIHVIFENKDNYFARKLWLEN